MMPEKVIQKGYQNNATMETKLNPKSIQKGPKESKGNQKGAKKAQRVGKKECRKRSTKRSKKGFLAGGMRVANLSVIKAYKAY